MFSVKGEKKMQEYNYCQIIRNEGKYLLYVYNINRMDDNGKWIFKKFNTIIEAKSHFKALYAPLKTKEVVKMDAIHYKAVL